MAGRLKKSLIISTAFLLVSFGSMLLLAIYLLQQASTQSAKDAWAQAQSSIEFQLFLNAETIHDNIRNHIQRAIETPELLALMASKTVEKSEQLSRNQVKTLVAEALRANPVANSAYMHFEANVYDGADALHRGDLQHSSNEGTLEVYWVRQPTGLQFYATPEPDFKYQQQPDAFGQSESEWYLCPSITRQRCITAPYWWQLEEGVQVQLMSVTLPIIVGDSVLGVAGVDLSMPEFNASITDFIRPLYGGNVRFFLLTEDARLLASNDYPGRVGESLSEVSSAITSLLVESEQRTFTQNGQDYLVERLQLDILNKRWQMLLLIPQHILLNEFTQARADFTKLSMRNMTMLILSSGALILITMAIALKYLHRRERMLNQSQAELELILRAAPTPISVAHLEQGNFRLQKVNQAWLAKFGFADKQSAQEAFADIALWSSETDKTRLMQQITEDGQVTNFIVWLKQREQREFLAEVSATLIATEAGSLLVMVYDDISDHYALQGQLLAVNDALEQRVQERTQELQDTISTLAKTQKELIQSEKLAALGNMVAGIAHELNTPVGNAVMAASRLKADYRTLATKAKTALTKSDFENFLVQSHDSTEILDRNLLRAAELIRSFKQVAVDQTSLQRRPSYLHEILDDVLLMLQPSIRKSGHSVTVQQPEFPILLDTYPGPLEQVLINLIQNALIHAFDDAPGQVRVTVSQQDQLIILSVADNGKGIPFAQQTKIFEPFFTTRLGTGGSGLGLSLVHNMVTGILKGQLRLESMPGEGSRFWITMPRVTPDG
ncbi:hypothetical protein GCM10010919_02620 [Alishewanella longhuensis]|uniref:histidine kinase n=1 Tax=Alishewanella longhuensis TaxID=1091037 RepID=A0ABQ3KT77_9ALTE|nr:ATP-binding protein [Alishewanella longhuensis]GHG59784.1 hypothetical protein GCM10010919_02620 [Alishewanella longhuensis]